MEISELQAEIDRQLEDYRVGKTRKRKDGNLYFFYNILDNFKNKKRKKQLI